MDDWTDEVLLGRLEDLLSSWEHENPDNVVAVIVELDNLLQGYYRLKQEVAHEE